MTEWRFLAYNAFAITCVVAAVVLLLNGKDGWGWLIALAAFTSISPKGSSDD